MQEVTHYSVAQSNTVKQFDCCSRGNSGCKYILILVQISVQIHRGRALDAITLAGMAAQSGLELLRIPRIVETLA